MLSLLLHNVNATGLLEHLVLDHRSSKIEMDDLLRRDAPVKAQNSRVYCKLTITSVHGLMKAMQCSLRVPQRYHVSVLRLSACGHGNIL
jgi:hypothetical protein